MKVLVLGATGMLGNAVFKCLQRDQRIEAWGTVRASNATRMFSKAQRLKIKSNIDILDFDSVVGLVGELKPDVIVNCVGLIKQLADANDPLAVLPINSMFPHRLSQLCLLSGTRLIHISTDCVFDGNKGMYVEEDASNATDLYGKSKFIGEVVNQSHVVTLRTSIIGHELFTNKSLVDWFLSQDSSVLGYKNAIFSGLPVIELADIIRNHVLMNLELTGLYHVASNPINKYALLKLVAAAYNKEIEIISDSKVKINRSLDSSKFQRESGYIAPNWEELVQKMYQDYTEDFKNNV